MPNDKSLTPGNRQIEAHALTYTIFWGFDRLGQHSHTVLDRSEAEQLLSKGQIHRWESREVDAAAYQSLKNNTDIMREIGLL